MMMKKYYLWAILLVCVAACKKDKDEVVIELNDSKIYTISVTLKSYWSAESHPQFFPKDARFGKIIGISHRENNLLFEEGNTPPTWSKSYFESENTADFLAYFQEYQEVQKVSAIINEEGMPANENKVFEFKTVGTNDKLSFWAKLMPSKNWFVAGNNIDLNRIAAGGSITYILPVFEAENEIQRMTQLPLSLENGGVNTFAAVTIYKISEESKED